MIRWKGCRIVASPGREPTRTQQRLGNLKHRSDSRLRPIRLLYATVPEPSPVRLVVYDVLSRQVRVLVDGVRDAGMHEVVFEARDLSSGTYLYRLETPAGSFVQVMQLVK